jgi:hypothetical protein
MNKTVIVKVNDDRSSVVDIVAYNVEEAKIIVRFKNSQRWYSKVMTSDVIAEASALFSEWNGVSFGKWAWKNNVFHNMNVEKGAL